MKQNDIAHILIGVSELLNCSLAQVRSCCKILSSETVEPSFGAPTAGSIDARARTEKKRFHLVLVELVFTTALREKQSKHTNISTKRQKSIEEEEERVREGLKFFSTRG